MNLKNSKDSLLFNIICDGTEIDGNIKVDGDFRIDGKLKGNIDCTGKVTLGYTGSIVGNITCQFADISGDVKGDVTASVLITLKENSKLEGSITTKNIIVEKGAVVEMKCSTIEL
jgi:cytoskeletal protein CcmA (bactofilin family)